MIKVRVKAPWMDGKGLHKIGDIAEIETAAFDPLRMEEIRENVVCEPIEIEINAAPKTEDVEEAQEEAPKPKKTTKKSTKKG